MKSEFDKLFPEDTEQLRDIFKRYKNKKVEDIQELYSISTTALILSQRWAEIQSMASIIAEETKYNKTDLYNWAHARYRNLQEMHIDCRSLYKCAREDLKNNLLMEN